MDAPVTFEIAPGFDFPKDYEVVEVIPIYYGKLKGHFILKVRPCET